jgi:hypothetical protein
MFIENVIYFAFFVMAYLFAGMFIVISLAKATSHLNEVKRGKQIRKSLAWSLFWLCLPLTPYLVVEIQTALLVKSLTPSVQQAIELDGGGGPILMLKVLRVRPAGATVYVINGTRTCSGGQTYDFKRTSQSWKYERYYNTIYSDCGGNADGNVFPPYLRPF